MLRNENMGSLERPMSVEQVTRMADEQSFDMEHNMQRYFRSANLMVKQAKIYEHEGNDRMAYFLLYRHARLILSDLLKHPEAKDPKHRKAWSAARNDVNSSLAKLEALKPLINARWERYSTRRQAPTPPTHPRDHSVHDLPVNVDQARLDPLQHQDLAVHHANREIRRRIAQSSEGSTREPANSDDAAIDLLRLRRQLDVSGRSDSTKPRDADHALQPPPYSYPSIPSGAKDVYAESSASGKPWSSLAQSKLGTILPSSGPALPPKLPEMGLHVSPKDRAGPPPVPSKVQAFPLASSTPEPVQQFLSSARLENGSSLRTIFLPEPLRHEFLKIAQRNTVAKLETCGILCGTLIRNAFFITKLVVPEQTSTSDTCEMINEEALYGYIDAQPEELMVLGWIHTHPTQTCFLSSRDLHTHVWYQVQLPESIAIVCSPSKNPDWGVYRLTDPPGVGAVKACTKPGIFHPHDETHLFTDVLGRPGHVIEHEDLHFETVDLRPR